MENRGTFASKLGIVLATAGSAVGLGNIWRFPYETGMNGGAAFLLVYLGCMLMLGLPAMLCEFIVGRHAQQNATRAYGGWPWKIVGYMGVFTGFIIMGFYSVVAGWTLQYVFAAIAGHLQGNDQARDVDAPFPLHHPFRDCAWRAERHRAGLQDHDARALRAVARAGGLFADAAGLYEGRGVPVSSRFH